MASSSTRTRHTTSPSPGAQPDAKRPRRSNGDILPDKLIKVDDEPPPLPNEVAITPDLKLPLNQAVLDTFFHWCQERHQIHLRRKAGLPQSEWTDDAVFRHHKFANVFRVLDRGTQFVLTDVIAKGEQTLDECIFRVIVFRSFARVSTYQLLEEALGGPPSYKSFTPELYENILLPHLGAGKPIYGSSYFIPAPREFKTQYPFQSTLRLISLMMRTGLPQRLSEMKHMRDAHAVICVYPSIGAFLGMQLLLDLNLTPYIDLSEDEYAACGPGSKSCLTSMFGHYVQGFELQAIQWLFKNQHDHWARLGIAHPPRLCDAREAGINVVDIEHALCEVHKYMRARDRKNGIARSRTKSRRKSGGGASGSTPTRVESATKSETTADGTDGLSFDKIQGESALSAEAEGEETEVTLDVKPKVEEGFYSLYDGELTYAIPEKWLVPRQADPYDRPAPLASSPASDAATEGKKPEEEIYEISHIVMMAQPGKKCLVRWKGFGPEDDTWEDYEELMSGDARESVEAYLAWPRLVTDEIAAMQREAKEAKESLRNADLSQLGSLPVWTGIQTRGAAAASSTKGAGAGTRSIGLPLAAAFGAQS